MKKGATSVRFSDDLSAILKRIARLYDVTDVAVVRWAVKALGVYHDAHGQLPPLTPTDPTKPLTLFEPERAEPRSNHVAGRSKMKKGSR